MHKLNSDLFVCTSLLSEVSEVEVLQPDELQDATSCAERLTQHLKLLGTIAQLPLTLEENKRLSSAELAELLSEFEVEIPANMHQERYEWELSRTVFEKIFGCFTSIVSHPTPTWSLTIKDGQIEIRAELSQQSIKQIEPLVSLTSHIVEISEVPVTINTNDSNTCLVFSIQSTEKSSNN